VGTATTGRDPSRGLIELIGKALIDHDLRDKLFNDPETVARRFDLPFEEAEALKKLDRRAFERAAAAVRWN